MCLTPNGVSPADTGNQKQYPNPVEELSIKEPLSFPQKGIDLKHISRYNVLLPKIQRVRYKASLLYFQTDNIYEGKTYN